MSAFEDDIEIYPEEETPVLALPPSGGEDWDGAGNMKDQANDAKASGNFEGAVDFLTKAMEMAGPSAMSLAARAAVLLQARRPLAALADCDAALQINPDSAKTLRCRGTVLSHLGRWEESLKSLAAAQAIDFDPDSEPLRKAVSARVSVIEADKVQQRLAEQEALREKVKKQREEMAQRRKEEEEEEARERAQGMGGGMPGGMGGGMGGGMPGGMDMQQMLMQMIMSDPELAAGLQNPKVMKAFSSMMGGGEGAAEMQDPEVKAFMDKFQEKMGPMMGMMGGMGGGMPGGMGGMPGGMGGMDEEDDEDMPDLEEVGGDGPSVEEVD